MYNEIVNETYASEKMKKIYDKHLRTIRRLEKYSGLELSKEDMATLDDQVFFLFDTLLVQVRYHFYRITNNLERDRIFPNF